MLYEIEFGPYYIAGCYFPGSTGSESGVVEQREEVVRLMRSWDNYRDSSHGRSCFLDGLIRLMRWKNFKTISSGFEPDKEGKQIYVVRLWLEELWLEE